MVRARILVIDDDALMREYVQETLVRAGHDVDTAESGQQGIEAIRKTAYDLVLTDLKMAPVDGFEVLRFIQKESRQTQCIMMTAYATVETAVAALKEGAVDYIMKPFSPETLEVTVTRVIEHQRLAQENLYLRATVNQPFDFHAMVGESGAMREVYEQIKKVANTRSTVLIRGESGTGKELVARAIHYTSNRATKPFIKVNCAALSAGLLESELFGHEKGSFTGAHDRKIGRFELAHEGTLLLDEISEISLELQPKLLRALQEREFERVGGTKTIQVDTRIICTSNRNLEQAVAEQKFRQDLFFRLNVIPIYLPPLRERKEDIPLLMEYFLKRFAQENGRPKLKFAEETRKLFQAYDWPGNVRELQNVIERAVVLTTEQVLTPDHFALDEYIPPKQLEKYILIPVGTNFAEIEKQVILRTLERCNQNRTRAAEILGISVRTLRNKLKEYGYGGTNSSEDEEEELHQPRRLRTVR
ncbi:MAG TPA: sigma-54 dependent transcriptional regulator [Candidatus Hydrogenedentes bacterium]|nr:sigma-54 dependent transcriptional regulator [Candidatus Hydrogenedentota bacterium]HOL78248.1 sigma-54 dependent transcriptional regulator [Candidatus Hydrogenedentota bacterium]HPO86388.1 sigma-54 dependent transcriptional regulator [Candidatus Hydrogenedentota bacterium]